MKLIAWALKVLGGLAITLTIMALLTATSVFVVGGYLLTWPILRQAPRTARKKAIAQVAVALFALAQTFQPEDDEQELP